MSFVEEDTITAEVLGRYENTPDPRLRRVLTSLVRHLHDFARDVELTGAEWEAAIDFLVRTGKMSDAKRNEMILVSDVFGLSMLTTMQNTRFPAGATPATITGPFHISDSPELPNGGDMRGGAPGQLCFMVGQVRDLDGSPVAGALLDVWQADEDGLYESQVGANDAYLRGIYRSDAQGRYCVRTVVPCHYSIPLDGTVGELVRATGVSHDRPAHIHLAVEAPGYQTLVTHLFREGAEFIDSDAVYGVREKLIVGFEEHPAGPTPAGDVAGEPFAVVRFDVVLSREKLAAPLAQAAQ